MANFNMTDLGADINPDWSEAEDAVEPTSLFGNEQLNDETLVVPGPGMRGTWGVAGG